MSIKMSIVFIIGFNIDGLFQAHIQDRNAPLDLWLR